MNTWTATYAQCIKATPGQLDREPFYRYQNQPVVLVSSPVLLDYEDPPKMGFKVQTEDGSVMAIEDTEHDAVQIVLFKLMANSRLSAERAI